MNEDGEYQAPAGGLPGSSVTGHRRPEAADGKYLEPRQTHSLWSWTPRGIHRSDHRQR